MIAMFVFSNLIEEVVNNFKQILLKYFILISFNLQMFPQNMLHILLMQSLQAQSHTHFLNKPNQPIFLTYQFNRIILNDLRHRLM
jgi:hypothetical protein